MPKFVFAYHGGSMPDNPAEVEELMGKWQSWLGGMGDDAVDFGNPVGPSKTVSASGVADDGGSNPISGYSLVNAADMDAAIEMAKGCPALENGGTVEVAEAMDM